MSTTQRGRRPQPAYCCACGAATAFDYYVTTPENTPLIIDVLSNFQVGVYATQNWQIRDVGAPVTGSASVTFLGAPRTASQRRCSCCTARRPSVVADARGSAVP